MAGALSEGMIRNNRDRSVLRACQLLTNADCRHYIYLMSICCQHRRAITVAELVRR